MYMKICWWHTMIEFWIRVHLNICIARHHKRWCFLRLGWTDPLKKLNAKLKYNIKREPVPQVLKWHTLYAQPSPYIQFFPCCTSDTPLCAFCNKRAVNAPRNLNSLRGISGGQGCTESHFITHIWCIAHIRYWAGYLQMCNRHAGRTLLHAPVVHTSKGSHTFYGNTISRWCIEVISVPMRSTVNIKTNGMLLADTKAVLQLLTAIYTYL